MTQTEMYELVVIGCGAGGLASARAFVEASVARGARPTVAVIERSRKAERGGATRWSWVNMMIDQEGNLDRTVLARVTAAHPDVDADYFQALERLGAGTVAWLAEHGVKLAYRTPPFAMSFGYGAMEGGGMALVEALAGAVEDYERASFLYETEALRLHTDDRGRVDGLVVRGADGLTRTIGAGSVVVATGGFEGSLEALTRYVGPRAGEILPVVPGVRHNVGDGLRMITEVGGATAGQFDKLHVQLVDARSSKPDAGIFGVPYGIVVDGSGARFVDEGEATCEALNAPLAWSVWRDHGSRAAFVFDARAERIPGFELLNQSDIEPITANSLAELAAALGAAPDVLEATIAGFNAAVQGGAFDAAVRDGKRTRGLAIDKSNWALPVAEPPFKAYPVVAAVTFSYGGVRTDTRARVVTPAGTPIPNLYAAGVVTGVWYGEYPGAMSVLRSVTFGRVAGQEAAAATQRVGIDE